MQAMCHGHKCLGDRREGMRKYFGVSSQTKPKLFVLFHLRDSPTHVNNRLE